MNNRVIVIAGEVFSPNLGDGIIAESMAYLVQNQWKGAEVRFLDISGRSTWGDPGASNADSNPPQKKRLSNSKLALLQNRIIGSVLIQLRWYSGYGRQCQRNWRLALEGASTLIIGGGNLLIDNRLDFPIKISELVHLASSLGLEIHFSACGVGHQWSWRARELLRASLNNSLTVSVRDQTSADRLRGSASRVSPVVTFDPAIVVDEVFPRKEVQRAKHPLIGLGIIDYRVANAYNSRGDRTSLADAVEFYQGIIDKLTETGAVVELFTNGLERDYIFAKELAENSAQVGPRPCLLAERPINPHDLTATITRYTAIIASRLHANIVATSYQIPAVGLIWDNKVKFFYEATGRGDYCFPLHATSPDEIVTTLQRAINEGINQSMLRRCKDLAYQNISTIDGTASADGTTMPDTGTFHE